MESIFFKKAQFYVVYKSSTLNTKTQLKDKRMEIKGSHMLGGLDLKSLVEDVQGSRRVICPHTDGWKLSFLSAGDLLVSLE